MRDRLRSFFAPPTKGASPPARLFWVALGLRLAYLTLAHTYRLRVDEDHFAFGYEMGRIARSLNQGTGYADCFANAYLRHTGPTAWVPPLYPLLLAGIFRLFGIYTLLSAWVICALDCLFSALTAVAVWEIAFRFAGTGAGKAGIRCARWSGWLWALHPAAMQYAVKWVWEMSLTTCLLAFVFVLTLRMAAEPARHLTRRWLLFGLLWGLIALSNSTVLLFLPVCGLWLLQKTRSFPNTVLAGLVFLACIAPWTLRNERVFHRFIPMRGNFGAEWYLGNGPSSTGFLMEHFHPYQDPAQLRLYVAMGEPRYTAMRAHLANQAIAARPVHFLADTLLRIDFFWFGVPHGAVERALQNLAEPFRITSYAIISLSGLLGLGLALHRRKPYAGLFAAAILLLPIPYYLVTAHARFRHPLEPLLCILGVFLFQSAQPPLKPVILSEDSQLHREPQSKDPDGLRPATMIQSFSLRLVLAVLVVIPQGNLRLLVSKPKPSPLLLSFP